MGFFDFEVTVEGGVARIRPTSDLAAEWMDESAPEVAVFQGGCRLVHADEVQGFATEANAAGFGVDW